MVLVARDHQEDVPADIHPVAPGRNAGSGNASELANYVVVKGKPLVVVAQ